MMFVLKVAIFLVFFYSPVFCSQSDQQNIANYTATAFNCFDSNFIFNLTIGPETAKNGNIASDNDIIEDDSTVQIIQMKTTDEVLIHELRIFRDIIVDQCGFTNLPGVSKFNI